MVETTVANKRPRIVASGTSLDSAPEKFYARTEYAIYIRTLVKNLNELVKRRKRGSQVRIPKTYIISCAARHHVQQP